MDVTNLSKFFDSSNKSLPPTDVKFLFRVPDGIKEVQAHKTILAFASDVFNREFFGSMTSEDEIVITDATQEVFQTMIWCIYSIEMKWKDYDLAYHAALYYLAEKYNIEHLRSKIIASIPKNKVTNDNFIDAITLAEDNLHHEPLSEALYDAAANFLKNDHKEEYDRCLAWFHEDNGGYAVQIFKVMEKVKKLSDAAKEPSYMECYVCFSAFLESELVAVKGLATGPGLVCKGCLDTTDIINTMMYGYIPSYHWMTAPHSTSPSSSPNKTTSSSSTCSRSSMFLEVMLYLHSGFHLLAVALSVSVLQHIDSDHRQTAVELVVVGMSGALTSILAIMGLWFRQRQFLLPLVVFLFATIVLDSISIFYYYVSAPSAEATYPTMTPISLYPNTDRMIPYLIVKLVFSIWLVKRLISMYRKNLTIRTGRSPLRKQSKPQSDSGSVEKKGEIEAGSPNLTSKVGKYSNFENCEEV